MNEDFVPYELAVKLKEKGFNRPCCGYYHIGKGDDSFEACISSDFLNSLNEYRVGAPTISQVLKWLREAKNVFIEISITTSGYYSTVYSNIDLTLANKTTYYQEYVGATNEDYNNCVLEAIEYVLDNLL